MKKLLRLFPFLLLLTGLFYTSVVNAQQFNEDREITYQDFYDELSPYGSWMDNPDHGYVWRPNVGNDFRPYQTNGRWIWNDNYEWMWVSDYNWGWAPFHYGRWFHDPFYGWLWVPGYEWSPAWVVWRGGGDYYGWAPLRPGINISVGFSIGTYNPPSLYWNFAPRRYITSTRLHRYYAPQSRNVTIINNTTIINNYNTRNNVFVTGPRRNEVERYTGRIRSVNVVNSNRPGRTVVNRNEVRAYRPGVNRNSNTGNYVPRTVERTDRNNWTRNERQGSNNVRTENERNAEGRSRGATPGRAYNATGNNNAGRTAVRENEARSADRVERNNRSRNNNRSSSGGNNERTEDRSAANTPGRTYTPGSNNSNRPVVRENEAPSRNGSTSSRVNNRSDNTERGRNINTRNENNRARVDNNNGAGRNRNVRTEVSRERLEGNRTYQPQISNGGNNNRQRAIEARPTAPRQRSNTPAVRPVQQQSSQRSVRTERNVQRSSSGSGNVQRQQRPARTESNNSKPAQRRER